ncbi:MAG: hypothetical protein OHK0017_11130 [Patescibacteria group bacterium]
MVELEIENGEVVHSFKDGSGSGNWIESYRHNGLGYKIGYFIPNKLSPRLIIQKSIKVDGGYKAIVDKELEFGEVHYDQVTFSGFKQVLTELNNLFEDLPKDLKPNNW